MIETLVALAGGSLLGRVLSKSRARAEVAERLKYAEQRGRREAESQADREANRTIRESRALMEASVREAEQGKTFAEKEKVRVLAEIERVNEENKKLASRLADIDSTYRKQISAEDDAHRARLLELQLELQTVKAVDEKGRQHQDKLNSIRSRAATIRREGGST